MTETFSTTLPPVQYIERIVRAGGCPVAITQWQSAGFDFRQLVGF